MEILTPVKEKTLDRTIRTAQRNNVLFLHFLESFCLNKDGANYNFQELGDFTAKYFNQEKPNDFLNKYTIAFGNYIRVLAERSPRTLEHSMEDLLKSFNDDLLSAPDENQIDYVNGQDTNTQSSSDSWNWMSWLR